MVAGGGGVRPDDGGRHCSGGASCALLHPRRGGGVARAARGLAVTGHDDQRRHAGRAQERATYKD